DAGTQWVEVGGPGADTGIIAGWDGGPSGPPATGRPLGGVRVTPTGAGGMCPARTIATAFANSPPLAYRCAGSFTNVDSISARTEGGTSGGNAGGVSRMCIMATVTALSDTNGRRPARHSYPHTASE